MEGIHRFTHTYMRVVDKGEQGVVYNAVVVGGVESLNVRRSPSCSSHPTSTTTCSQSVNLPVAPMFGNMGGLGCHAPYGLGARTFHISKRSRENSHLDSTSAFPGRETPKMFPSGNVLGVVSMRRTKWVGDGLAGHAPYGLGTRDTTRPQRPPSMRS